MSTAPERCVHRGMCSVSDFGKRSIDALSVFLSFICLVLFMHMHSSLSSQEELTNATRCIKSLLSYPFVIAPTMI